MCNLLNWILGLGSEVHFPDAWGIFFVFYYKNVRNMMNFSGHSIIALTAYLSSAQQLQKHLRNTPLP